MLSRRKSVRIWSNRENSEKKPEKIQRCRGLDGSTFSLPPYDSPPSPPSHYLLMTVARSTEKKYIITHREIFLEYH